MHTGGYFMFIQFIVALVLLFGCDSPSKKEKNAPPKPEKISEVPDSLKGRLWDIPHLEKITIDGDKSDWKGKGTVVVFFSDAYGNIPQKNDLSATMNIAWTNDGLLLYAEVTDDIAWENKNIRGLWRGDAIDIFMSEKWGVQNTTQIVIAPGWAKQTDSLRVYAYDHRNSPALRDSSIHCIAASQFTDSCYQIEALIPFSNLNIEPKTGNEFGLQVYIHDGDGWRDTNTKLEWHYLTRSYLNPFSHKRIRLTENSAFCSDIAVKSYIEDLDTARFFVFADSTYAGKNIMIINNNKILLNDTLQTDSTGAFYQFNWRIADIIDQHLTPHVFVDSVFQEIIDLSFVNVAFRDSVGMRFVEYMRRFSAYPKYRPEKQNPIVFTGSSTITKWFSIEEDLKPLNVVNRGFGGSQAPDVLHNFRTLFLPIKPSKIVFYEGDNDITYGMTPKELNDTCRAIIDSVYKVLPETEFYIMAIKPSPYRKKHWDKMKAANDSLKALAKNYKHVKYIDIANVMLDEKGEMRMDIYLNDFVHLNNKGYKIISKKVLDALSEKSESK